MSHEPKPGLDPDDAVPVRHRHDGWTPERQTDFIEALAESGCVDEACRRVRISRTAAYELRARPDATAFRLAWDAALDHAIRALTDAAFSRALNGVARPVFYKGELVGERRYYDERLTMFLLRYRDPSRYGAWLDRVISQRPPDHEARLLSDHIDRMEADACADELGFPRPAEPYPQSSARLVSEADWVASSRPVKRKTGGT